MCPQRSDEPKVILVIEDEPKTQDILGIYLEGAGYMVKFAAEGRHGLRQAEAHNPDLIVLDLMLPGMDGWSVCRRLREHSDVPILILSARQEEQDRLLGLGLGADDYVVKPFSPREIVLRVQAILRRTNGKKLIEVEPDLLGLGPIQIDTELRRVTAHGTEVMLTPSEYKLLLAMLRRPGKTFERSELLDHLYPTGGAVVPKVVDVHIGKLRQKIERDPSHPKFVETVRGFGYRFVDTEA